MEKRKIVASSEICSKSIYHLREQMQKIIALSIHLLNFTSCQPYCLEEVINWLFHRKNERRMTRIGLQRNGCSNHTFSSCNFQFQVNEKESTFAFNLLPSTSLTQLNVCRLNAPCLMSIYCGFPTRQCIRSL